MPVTGKGSRSLQHQIHVLARKMSVYLGSAGSIRRGGQHTISPPRLSGDRPHYTVDQNTTHANLMLWEFFRVVGSLPKMVKSVVKRFSKLPLHHRAKEISNEARYTFKAANCHNDDSDALENCVRVHLLHVRTAVCLLLTVRTPDIHGQGAVRALAGAWFRRYTLPAPKTHSRLVLPCLTTWRTQRRTADFQAPVLIGVHQHGLAHDDTPLGNFASSCRWDLANWAKNLSDLFDELLLLRHEQPARLGNFGGQRTLEGRLFPTIVARSELALLA